jgi:site-specific DNA-methyltransferase (adenine-specific)
MRTYNGYSFDFESVAKELYRVTKPGGVVVWVVADQTLGLNESGTSFRQALYFKECGFNLLDTMIWEKAGMLPATDRYYNVFEYMFVFSKGRPAAMNFICDCKTTNPGRIQEKDVCASSNGERQRGEGTFVRNEFGKRSNIWKVPSVKNTETGCHPAPFPEAIARDHIITWSNPGDLIYDPFMGSGTTAKMALALDRHYIGSEISEEYCKVIDKRLKGDSCAWYRLMQMMPGDA